MRLNRYSPWIALTVIAMVGCSGGNETTGGSGGGGAAATGEAPVFSLAWSEYPSWSIFGVAHEMDLVDGDEGKLGEIERKWGVDIVLQEAPYDGCLNMFASNNCDAVCITNMDALIVSPNRDAVAVLPTSTSNGADACITTGINNLEELKPHKVFGLEGTVSQYCFVRCIEEIEKKEQKGYRAEDFDFSNQDPGAAAVAMSQKQKTHHAIMVWNPFVLQTLKDRSDAKVLFDSSMIPGEIVDMVVVGRDVLKKPDADKFVQAIIDVFYRMNQELANPETGDQALVALGEKFSRLSLEDMKIVVQQTQFYKTADEAIELMEGEAFKVTMETVKAFCVKQGLVTSPQYTFGPDAKARLSFDASYLKAWKENGS
ncbi:MAG: hypothetical protein ACC628_02140 [Pirellulaceae bacterium]